ncbi:MAG TPA: hypothetical protein GXZ53_07860 [Firmicutes bacterium]|nr:hypothetical protein [Bacillota bacterium]
MPPDRKKSMSEEEKLYETYALKLYEALVAGKGLNGLLTTALYIFNNPILIADNGFKVLAHIEPSGFEDTLWKQIIQNGYYPHDYLKVVVDDDDLYASVFSSTPSRVFSDTASPNKYLCKAIKANGKPVGFATCVEHGRVFTPLDIRLFDLFCKIVGVELRAENIARQNHTERYDYIICEMLSGSVNKDFAEERIKLAGLKLMSNYYILVANDAKIRRDNQMEYYKQIFERVLPSSYCVVYHNSLVLLLNQKHQKKLPEKNLADINRLLESFDMFAGLSHRFSCILEIDSHYKQACEAVDIGRKLHEGRQRLYKYEDILCYHLIKAAQQAEDLKSFCHPKLLDIIEYDTEYKTNYAMTAYVYFSSNRNPAQAAKKLNVHRNTIDYRIKRLEELFDLDFNNNDIVFSFELSFRILRFLAVPPFD